MKIVIATENFFGPQKFLDLVACLVEPFHKEWTEQLKRESILARVQELFCSLACSGIAPKTALEITKDFFLKGKAIFDLSGPEECLVIKPIGSFKTSLTLIEITTREEKEGLRPSALELLKVAEKMESSKSKSV